MKVISEHIEIPTKGNTEIINISEKINSVVKKSGIKDGIVTLFVVGSTAGLSTIEFEPGLLKDLPETFEKIAPMKHRYHHDDTWHDGNGYAHIRSTLLGTSLTIPIEDGATQLGVWQQVVLIDFDNRPRQRKIICKILGA